MHITTRRPLTVKERVDILLESVKVVHYAKYPRDYVYSTKQVNMINQLIHILETKPKQVAELFILSQDATMAHLYKIFDYRIVKGIH